MKDEGIVVQVIEYKETSKIVHLYTKNGFVSVKALGAASPKKGLLGFTTIGNCVSFVATDSSLPTLVEYSLEHSVFKIVEDIVRVNVFQIMLDVIKGIPQDTKHSVVYPFFKKCLVDLMEENPKKLLALFLIKMLYSYSIQPNLKSCTKCNSKEVVSLHLFEGGAFCGACSNKNNQDELYIWHEYYYDKKSVKDYTPCNYDALLKDIFEYYQRYAHVRLHIKTLFTN